MSHWTATSLLLLTALPLMLPPSQDSLTIASYESPHDDSSTPSDTPGQGLGSRGDCEPAEFPLTAIVPDHIGLTTAERPVVWVYLPFALSVNSPAVLELEDDMENVVYRSAPITSTISPGFLALPIAHSLEVGETYKWVFSVYCDSPRMSDAPARLRGLVQRVAPNAFPANQRWYDLLNAGAARQRSNAPDSEWRELLEFIDQEQLVEEPILP